MAIGTALHHVNASAEGPTRSVVGVFDNAYHGGVLAFGPTDGPHNPLNAPFRFRVASFDDPSGFDAMFDDDLACVLIEPVQGSGGCRPASPAFLNELRERCDDAGVVLIFDEVMTSRLAHGGAQQRYDVAPDMTTLGKYLAGGMTFGAFGGRREIMANFDPSVEQPSTKLTQAGTFNNNVVSMSAAIATLRHELDADTLQQVNDRGDRLRADLNEAFQQSGAALWVTGLGSMLCVHADDDRIAELYFHAMLERGLYLARRGFIGLSMAVTDDDCETLVAATIAWASGLAVTAEIGST